MSLHRLIDLVGRAASEPDVLRSLWLEIDAVTAPEREFSSACRQFVASQIVERGLTKP